MLPSNYLTVTLQNCKISNAQVNLAEQFKEMNEIAFNWLVDTKKQYNVKDYGFVFEKFINN
ncbi:TPA: hypothetical protein QCW92_002376 [Bacillus paranthracis]|uniref:YvbH-like oligomerization region n=1 Tax=Bacillus pacificus TaxID=2026187 RepID=A0A3P1C6F9_9BACI|nr:hypothetical protein YBT020_22060 [Bacillus thuringiensis serovar finitimus YBT-020]AFQ10461.1 hypothetical protein BCK_12815 [Bacillus cereus FRI-35]KXX95152.1 hypothetical protein AT277_08995 [Bacillus cereus]MCZ7519762.1 hypothetical protein [Bacillus pacificus]MRC73260.1 hypothetical protein [Bacillus thuringiensis]OTX76507.1 hypothetical protein BK722_03530 [Bacillus thuringiensis serovar finitimus]HDR4706088.1 hypothetical protein [Bacillus paranthracis]